MAVHDIPDDGTCAPRAIAMSYGMEPDAVMQQASMAFDGRKELCSNIFNSLKSERLPRSMRILFEHHKKQETSYEEKIKSMLAKEEIINDTRCYYWWDYVVLEIYCAFQKKNIAVLENLNDEIRLRQLFRGGGETFAILLFDKDHFMTCSLNGVFEFKMNDPDLFFSKFDKVAKILDPKRERWFVTEPEQHERPSGDASESEQTAETEANFEEYTVSDADEVVFCQVLSPPS